MMAGAEAPAEGRGGRAGGSCQPDVFRKGQDRRKPAWLSALWRATWCREPRRFRFGRCGLGSGQTIGFILGSRFTIWPNRNYRHWCLHRDGSLGAVWRVSATGSNLVQRREPWAG